MFSPAMISTDIAVSFVESPSRKEPEFELWRCVLWRALSVARGEINPSTRQEIKYLSRRAAAWFQSKWKGPGSFLWVCEMLDFDPQAVR